VSASGGDLRVRALACARVGTNTHVHCLQVHVLAMSHTQSGPKAIINSVIMACDRWLENAHAVCLFTKTPVPFVCSQKRTCRLSVHKNALAVCLFTKTPLPFVCSQKRTCRLSVHKNARAVSVHKNVLAVCLCTRQGADGGSCRDQHACGVEHA
jgi:hypothetical protein